MITNYIDYITENKLELVLEAKITYTSNFMEVLNKIDSPIAKKLISLQGDDKDIDRNYIDINKDKIDSILFKPQDKINKVNYKLISNGNVYDNLSISAQKLGLINKFVDPISGEKGKIIKELTIDELNKISPSNLWNYIYYNNGDIIVVFEFEIESKSYQALTTKSNLVKDYSSITNTDVNVGRFIRAFLTKIGEKFTDKQIENFVDQYKKVMQMKNDIFSRFKEIKGEDIKHCYLVDNYESESGSLGGSCMRYPKCQDFFDIYVENPDKVSMVILLSEEDSSKIAGRAILWLDDNDRYIMDRIYFIRTADILLFKEYCNSKGYYHKKSQDYSSITSFILNGDELDDYESKVVITLKKKSYEAYPYMDTMKYYSSESGLISNRHSSVQGYIELTETDGGPYEDGDDSCTVCHQERMVNCPECDGRSEIRCRDCNGTGQNGSQQVDLTGVSAGVCGNCRGSGMTICDICDGDGRISCPECN